MWRGRALVLLNLVSSTWIFIGCGDGAKNLQKHASALVDDQVCGRLQSRGDAYWAENSHIYFGEQEIRLKGINWFGLELSDRAPHGLWTRDLDAYLGQIHDLGFTALRLPLSPESIRPGYSSARWALRGEIDTGREQLESLLQAAGRHDLRVLLSFHTCNPAQVAGQLPGAPDRCQGYQVSDWLADLETLGDLSNTYFPTVLGVDLVNEPHALDWSRWKDLATQGGSAVLCRNARILVFVEGVGNASNNGGYAAFWGENLTEAGWNPIPSWAIPDAKLIYSPHVYGPSVASMDYFQSSNFPWNLPEIWDRHFGHLDDEGKNVVVGEFCGWYDDSRARGDVAFQDTIVDYLQARDIKNFFYWALNPNSGDTGGILLNDWSTPNGSKLNLLRRLMNP